VFVHDQATGKTTRVSVSSSGRQQNASVAPPFGQVSNLSADGHYVVFDSDATNLVTAPTNGHTNVFRHSLVDGHTALVSRSALGKQGNNDSFSPATSADGRVTVFESFADNLASPWTPSENVFAQDLLTNTMLTPDVTPEGGPRGPELDAQLLQQPAVSADGQVVAFTSGANNLVAGDYNGTDDLFVRVLTPPSTKFVQAPALITTDRRPLVQFTGSTALATFGYCELDGQRLACPVGTPFHLPTVGPGSHVLKAFTGAPGTLFDSQGAEAHFMEL
jgi:Tol biopolymer transport system component